MDNLLIGADPEFFVERNGHFISAHVFEECGTKHEPKLTKNGAVQIDGMALEVNVRPSRSATEFVTNFCSVMNDLEEIVARHPFVSKARILNIPAVRFGKGVFAQTPEENQQLGCEPDFNAYTGRMNPRPDSRSEWRTGSGHVHVGFTEGQNHKSRSYIEHVSGMVKQLDYFLGVPSLLWDGDDTRRRLYGKAGAFRPKPYGFEYRVLSNAWCTTENHKLPEWVFNRTVAAMKAYDSGNIFEKKYPGVARQIIDGNIVSWRKDWPDLAKEVLV